MCVCVSVRNENFFRLPDADLKRSFGKGVFGNAEDDRNSFRSIRPILIKILTILFYTRRIEIIDFQVVPAFARQRVYKGLLTQKQHLHTVV